MSENYRSREERRQVKEKNSQLLKHKNQKVKHHFFRKFLITCLLLGIVGLVGGVATFFVMIKDAPKLEKANLLIRYPQKFMIKMAIWYMNTGKKSGRMLRMIKFLKLVENAFLATEDSRFYEHSGVDFKRYCPCCLGES